MSSDITNTSFRSKVIRSPTIYGEEFTAQEKGGNRIKQPFVWYPNKIDHHAKAELVAAAHPCFYRDSAGTADYFAVERVVLVATKPLAFVLRIHMQNSV